MDILYIIGEGKSKCNDFELKMSLRSLAQFGKGIGRIFVAGYCPEWVSDEIIKIPINSTIIKENLTQHEKHINIFNTLLYAVDNSDIGMYDDGEFLVSMDDHMYVKNVDFNNYPIYNKIYKYAPEDNPNELPNRKFNISYVDFLFDTRKILESLGLTVINFTLHRNMHIRKKDIEKYRNEIETLINNKFVPEPFCFLLNCRYTEEPFDFVRVKDVKISNGSQWWKTSPSYSEVFSTYDFYVDSALYTLLNGLFPNKSKYEK